MKAKKTDYLRFHPHTKGKKKTNFVVTLKLLNPSLRQQQPDPFTFTQVSLPSCVTAVLRVSRQDCLLVRWCVQRLNWEVWSGQNWSPDTQM